MATIDELMKRLEKLDVLQVAVDSIEATRAELIERQKEQLYDGKTGSGDDITPFYRPATIAMKRKKGQPTDRVTLRDKGEFYAGVFVDVRSDSFITDSADAKAAALTKKYGDDILKLGGRFKEAYVEDLRPVFQERIEEVTSLNFSP
jgi:hypothetical protein